MRNGLATCGSWWCSRNCWVCWATTSPANYQVICFSISLLEGFAPIELHVDLKAFIFQNIRDQACHGGLIFHNQNAIGIVA